MRQFEFDSLLSSDDARVAHAEFDKMWKALNTTDLAGAVTADLKAQPVVEGQVRGAIENIKDRFSVSAETGEKFTIDSGGRPQRVVARGANPPPGAAPGRATGGGKIAGKIGGAASIIDAVAMAYYIYAYGLDDVVCGMSGMFCPLPEPVA